MMLGFHLKCVSFFFRVWSNFNICIFFVKQNFSYSKTAHGPWRSWRFTPIAKIKHSLRRWWHPPLLYPHLAVTWWICEFTVCSLNRRIKMLQKTHVRVSIPKIDMFNSLSSNLASFDLLPVQQPRDCPTPSPSVSMNFLSASSSST